MPLPFGLDSPASSLPMGIDAASADASSVYSDVVEIAGKDFACEVMRPTKTLSATRRDQFATEYGLTKFLVKFPDYVAEARLNAQIIWKVEARQPLPVHYVLIALTPGVVPRDEAGDNHWAIEAEWKGGLVPASPADPSADATGPTGPIIPAEPVSRSTNYSVAAGAYVLSDGTTAAVAAGAAVAALPADGVTYVWLDSNGHVQATP